MCCDINLSPKLQLASLHQMYTKDVVVVDVNVDDLNVQAINKSHPHVKIHGQSKPVSTNGDTSIINKNMHGPQGQLGDEVEDQPSNMKST